MTPFVQICIKMCPKAVMLNHHHGNTTKSYFSTTYSNSYLKKKTFQISHLKFLKKFNT